MTNRGSNHQHGLHTMNKTRPKKKTRNKAARAKAKIRSEKRQAAIESAKKEFLS